ncbi:MAG TPA: transglycosylase SLT domain-containing protein [Actinocrinis sp.]|nr:transglycosylase SLT domain-containing protein [Actinocrinis sp.]
MPSHRKPKLHAARNQARTLTLCAATIGAAAVPALASAASATSGTTSGPVASHTAPQQVIAQAVADTRPASHHSKTAHVSSSSSSNTTDYTVQAGDTLFGIASRSLGSGYKYPQLFKMNKNRSETGGETFTNPDLIRTGWTISIPSSTSSSSSDTSGTDTSGSSGTSGSGSSSDDSSSSGSSSAAGSSDSSGSSNSSAASGSGSDNSSSSSGSSSSSSSSATTSSSTSSSGYADDLDGWIKQAVSILAANGYSVSYNAIYQTAMNESSGNPNAENGWDSNAAAGTPSIGLLQVIQPTFDAYALPGYGDIWNPVDNIIAGAIYAQATYGGLDNVVAARCGGSCWSGY